MSRAPSLGFQASMSTHLLACGLTRSPAADRTNCCAALPLQFAIWITAPFAVDPQATSMPLLFEVCRVPLVKAHFCAALLLQPHICSGTPSEKLPFGTSMHLLLRLLISEPPPLPPPL